MSDVVCSDPSYVPRKVPSKYCCSETIVIRSHCNPQGLPTGQTLWIREKRYDQSSKGSRSERERKKIWWYLLKDGPGEDAKDVGWASEDSLILPNPPKKEESLIDLDPGYPVKEEEPLIDLD